MMIEKLKKRRMHQSRWDGVEIDRYAQRMVSYRGRPAIAGLCRLSTGTPVYAKDLKIVDEGFLWLQLAPMFEPWWLTAMYDEKGGFVQFYFDVAAGFDTSSTGEPSFIDLIVDVVVSPGESPRILDEDELDAACAEGVLSSSDAAEIMKIAQDIVRDYADCGELRQYCDELLESLRKDSRFAAIDRGIPSEPLLF